MRLHDMPIEVAARIEVWVDIFLHHKGRRPSSRLKVGPYRTGTVVFVLKNEIGASVVVHVPHGGDMPTGPGVLGDIELTDRGCAIRTTHLPNRDRAVVVLENDIGSGVAVDIAHPLHVPCRPDVLQVRLRSEGHLSSSGIENRIFPDRDKPRVVLEHDSSPATVGIAGRNLGPASSRILADIELASYGRGTGPS